MPEIQDLAFEPREAATENDIGATVEDRGQHARIIQRIVLQIGILKDGQIAAHLADRPPKRRAFPHVSRLPEYTYLGISRRQSTGDQPCTVTRAVVDHNNLTFEAG